MTEWLKLGASGLQATAISLFLAVLVAPSFNAQLNAPLWASFLFAIVASTAEGLAFFLLRLLPSDP